MVATRRRRASEKEERVPENEPRPNATIKRARKSVGGRAEPARADVDRVLETASTSTNSLQSLGIYTSEDLIRTLKGSSSSSTATTSSPDSIEVARLAWEDEQIAVPRKADLIIDWLLGSLDREARTVIKNHSTATKKSQPTLVLADVRHWRLATSLLDALQSDDIYRLASRHSPELVLLVTGTAVKAYTQGSDSDQHKLASLLSAINQTMSPLTHAQTKSAHAQSLDTVLNGLSGWLSLGAYICSQLLASASPSLTTEEDHTIVTTQDTLASMAEVMHTVVSVWLRVLGKPGTLGKSREAFLTTMLGEFSRSLACLDSILQSVSLVSAPITRIAELYRSSLLRISYECLFNTSQIDHNVGRQIVEHLSGLDGDERKWHALPVLLAQRCLQLHQPSGSNILTFQEQAVKRQQVYSEMVVPFARALTKTSIDTTCFFEMRLQSLASILKLEEEHNLDAATDEGATDSQATVLMDAISFSIGCLRKGKEIQTQRTVEATLDVLEAAHTVDSTAITAEQWATVGSVLATFDSFSAARRMLRSVSESAARQRTLDTMVGWIFDAVTLASSQMTRNEEGQAALERPSVQILRSTLLERHFWHEHLGNALQSFTSGDQTLGLISLIQDRLQKSVDIFAQRKSKTKPSKCSVSGKTPHGVPDLNACCSIVMIYLTSLVVTHVAIPVPNQEETIVKLRSILDDITDPLVAQALKSPDNEDAAALGAAALTLSRAIALRSRSLGKGGAALSLHIDLLQDRQLDGFRSLLRSDTGLAELRLLIHLEALERISRNELTGVPSSFSSFLKDQKIFRDLLNNRKPMESTASSEWTHGIETVHMPLWSAVTANYLGIYDRHAAPELRANMARAALNILQEAKDVGNGELLSFVENLTRNAGNVELRGWQGALTHEIQQRLERGSKPESLALFATLSQLPVDFIDPSSATAIIRRACSIIAAAAAERSSQEDAMALADAIRWLLRLIDATSTVTNLAEASDKGLNTFATSRPGDTQEFRTASLLLLRAALNSVQIRDPASASSLAEELIQGSEPGNMIDVVSSVIEYVEHSRRARISAIAETASLRGQPESISGLRHQLRVARKQNLQAAAWQCLGLAFFEKIKKGSDEELENSATLCCVEAMQCIEEAIDEGSAAPFEGEGDWLKATCAMLGEIISTFQISPHLVAAPVVRASLRASHEEYSSALQHEIAQLVASRSKSSSKWHAHAQVLTLILCNGPEGSLTVAQGALLSYFAILAELEGPGFSYDEGSVLRVAEVLEALVTGKTMLFRTRESSALLAVITYVLAPRAATSTASGKHAAAIFSSLTSSITTLVRLRPEALSSLLPQLTIILTQLVGLFREPAKAEQQRQRLHAASSRADGGRPSSSTLLPPWINIRVTGPLGVAQARALSRLCSAVTSRSTTSAGAETGKASKRHPDDHHRRRTMAKPFGNHAVYVLLAYLRSLTRLDEPSSAAGAVSGRGDRNSATAAPIVRPPVETVFASGETGQEVARAMYSVCDVVGTWQRNVLMDLLADDGERIIARRLFRSYEAQRYKGE